MHSFPPYCRLTEDLDWGGSSQSLPCRDLAFPEDSTIDDDTLELRDDDDGDDDDGSGKAVLIATKPVLLSLLNLPANVLLLVAEEKSERSVPELTALDGVLLSDAVSKGKLDCRYCKIVFSGLVTRTPDVDEREEEMPLPWRSLV